MEKYLLNVYTFHLLSLRSKLNAVDRPSARAFTRSRHLPFKMSPMLSVPILAERKGVFPPQCGTSYRLAVNGPCASAALAELNVYKVAVVLVSKAGFPSAA